MPLPSQQNLKRAYQSYYGDGATGSEASPESLGVQLVALVDEMSCPRDRVLDYGSGTGEIGSVFRASGSEVIGIENNDAFRQKAECRLDAVFASLDQLGDQQFCMILLIEVIEHVLDPFETLIQLRKRMRPGSLIIITTPRATSLQARLRGRNWREAKNPTHLTLFSPSALAVLLKAAGYSQLEVGAHFSYAEHGFMRANAQRILRRFHIQGNLTMFASIE